MAVTRSSSSSVNGYDIGPSDADLVALQNQITALRQAEGDTYSSFRADGLATGTDASGTAVLPTDDDSTTDGSNVDPSGSYAQWQSQLSQLSSSDNPDFSGMIAAADTDGVPRQTAVSDIFDAMGMTDASSSDQQLGNWMSTILQHADGLDPDVLSSILDMLATIADPESVHNSGSNGNLSHVSQLQALKSQMNELMGKMDSMQSDMSSGFGNLQSQIDQLSKQVAAWQKYNTSLQGFENKVQVAAQSGDALSPTEVNGIVDNMATIAAPGEPANYVSAAEWNATVAGINNADITATQATVETGQVAQEILDRASDGTLTVDPSVQGDITAAASAGTAAADTSTAAAPADPAAAAPAAPVDTSGAASA